MMTRACWYAATLGLLGLILVSLMSASASTNTIAGSNLAYTLLDIDANALKPGACAGLDLASIVTASGVITGNSSGTLILGSPGADTLAGLDGDDCIVGGGGADTLSGGGGDDVLLGGPGSDTCTGGFGDDSFSSCETEAP